VLSETESVPVVGKPTALFHSMNGERLNIDDDYDESKTMTSLTRIMKNHINSENVRNQ
jgi:hypothetical protein